MIATTKELLKKYDVPGPRYTSYPTVLCWEQTPTAAEWSASAGAMALGLAGIAVAWVLYGRRRRVRARDPLDVPLFANKFYWDELYDWLWYRPGDAIARALARGFERPLIAGSLDALTRGFGLGSRGLGVAQNGLVRSYALALAGGLAVLAVVFLSVR